MKAKTYKYTKELIALAAGIKASKVRKDVRNMVFFPEDMRSTACYVSCEMMKKLFAGKLVEVQIRPGLVVKEIL